LSLCSKVRCIGIRGLVGLPHVEGNKIVVVDDREGLGIVTALEIERLILGSVDVDNLTWLIRIAEAVSASVVLSQTTTWRAQVCSVDMRH
jgi:hypothetical protein